MKQTVRLERVQEYASRGEIFLRQSNIFCMWRYFPSSTSARLLRASNNRACSERLNSLSEICQQFKHVVIGQLVAVLSEKRWEASTFIKCPGCIFKQGSEKRKKNTAQSENTAHLLQKPNSCSLSNISREAGFHFSNKKEWCNWSIQYVDACDSKHAMMPKKTNISHVC